MKKLIVLIALILLVACGGGTAVTPTDVITAFQEAGLEAETPMPMTADDYGLAPMVGEGVRFLIPSLGEDKGGRVIVTDNSEDAEKLVTYYTSLGEASALFFTWAFRNGNTVVQINGDLPESTARQYEAALNAME